MSENPKYINIVESVTVGKISVLLILDEEIPSHSVIDEETGKAWIFLNINDENIFETLSHELLHVLGLNEEQVEKIIGTIKKYIR